MTRTTESAASSEAMTVILRRIAEQETLSRSEAERAMSLMLSGTVPPESVAGLLLGLRARGETDEELLGFTHVMRTHAVQVESSRERLLDVVGTGGDGSGTFNISTTAAIVCAGAGAAVAKHGNRAASSRCGSAQVLEALGVNIELGKAGVERCLEEAGLAFMFAPLFHPAMKHVVPIRRALGVRTCFNILGPMCNPAGARSYLMGAFDLELAERMVRILSGLGADRVVAAHSDDGLDEISICGPTTLFVRMNGSDTVKTLHVSPGDFGMEAASLDAITGGDAEENAAITTAALDGKPGPKRDVVVLNAGAALWAAGTASSMAEGIEQAIGSIDSGAARRALAALVKVSNRPPAEHESR